MSALDQLNGYLGKLEGRLRQGAISRGALVMTAAALTATVVLVFLMNQLAFAGWTIIGGRVLLASAIGAAIGLGLVRPWKKLNRHKAAVAAESAYPDFEQRLVTIAERADKNDPFIGLLASETLDVAQRTQPAMVFPTMHLAAFGGAALASIGLLMWLILSGPGFWGHGAKLLWSVMPASKGATFYEVKVLPGNITIRRGSDQLVTVTPIGFSPSSIQLYAKFGAATKWEPVEMRPANDENKTFEFLFAGLTEPVGYYVQSGAVKSEEFTIKVKDLAQVKKIDVSYKFPSWTGMSEVKEPNGGDLRAVEGTEATLVIKTDRPIENGLLVVDGDKKGTLTKVGDNTYTAKVTIEKDGMYHVSSMDGDEQLRLSQDYFIEARKETEPVVKVTSPGRDYKASPIEEVGITVTAEDDFGLKELQVHYSVNGGEEQIRNLGASGREANGKIQLALEDFKLVPGDLVSFYATAKDARSTARTDMFFIEAQPFEKQYSQSQAGGGGGGGGGQQDDNQISERQKEIIAATFNQIKDKKATDAQQTESGKFLSDVQAKLRDQADSLAERMKKRELSGENQEFATFEREMRSASQAMQDAAMVLKAKKWQDSLAPEQKALQHLLRAESTFRQIQVAFGSQGGGGGGGGGANRDLESLFDLELDTEKNQYETGQNQQQAGGGGQDKEKQVDEALARLKELARRQQELASQAQNKNQQSFQQRWQQEMLKREAEQLQKQMEQLQRNSQQGQQGQQQGQQSGQQASGQQSGQQSGQGQAGQQGQQQGGQQQNAQRNQQGGDPRLQKAMDNVKQALEDMKKAQAGQNSGDPKAQEDARRAADRLQQAMNALQGMQQQDNQGRLGGISNRSSQLAEQQREATRKLTQAAAGGQQMTQLQAQAAAQERDKMLEQLNQLEREVNDAVRRLGPSEKDATNKLREGLAEMQQNEIKLRMQYNADGLRRGAGARVAMNEQPVIQGLDRMRDQIREAEQALASGKTGDRGKQGVESALDKIERMRQQMAGAGRQPGNQPGDQQGQGKGQGQGQGKDGQQKGQGQQAGNQPGQQKGQGQGQQPGQGQGQGQGEGQGQGQGQGQQAGNQGGGQGGGSYGGGSYNGGGFGYYGGNYAGGYPDGPVRAADVEQAYRDNMRNLEGLRGQFRDDPEALRNLTDATRQLAQIDPSKFKGNPELVEGLREQVLSTIDQLEMQLRRKLDGELAGQVRSGASKPVPSGYKESVADYYRRLGKGK